MTHVVIVPSKSFYLDNSISIGHSANISVASIAHILGVHLPFYECEGCSASCFWFLFIFSVHIYTFFVFLSHVSTRCVCVCCVKEIYRCCCELRTTWIQWPNSLRRCMFSSENQLQQSNNNIGNFSFWRMMCVWHEFVCVFVRSFMQWTDNMSYRPGHTHTWTQHTLIIAIET